MVGDSRLQDLKLSVQRLRFGMRDFGGLGLRLGVSDFVRGVLRSTVQSLNDKALLGDLTGVLFFFALLASYIYMHMYMYMQS